MINKLQLILTAIVFSLIFFFIITPVGLVIRFLGCDFLKLNNKSEGKTYWQKK